MISPRLSALLLLCSCAATHGCTGGPTSDFPVDDSPNAPPAGMDAGSGPNDDEVNDPGDGMGAPPAGMDAGVPATPEADGGEPASDAGG